MLSLHTMKSCQYILSTTSFNTQLLHQSIRTESRGRTCLQQNITTPGLGQRPLRMAAKNLARHQLRPLFNIFKPGKRKMATGLCRTWRRRKLSLCIGRQTLHRHHYPRCFCNETRQAALPDSKYLWRNLFYCELQEQIDCRRPVRPMGTRQFFRKRNCQIPSHCSEIFPGYEKFFLHRYAGW